jgi:uncharacterized protein
MIDKPSDKEQEYFIRKELERIKAMREEHVQKQQAAERARLKDLHFMRCAKCGQTMTTISLTEIDVELCPGCGGMYLDQGELAKLIEANQHGALASAITSARRIWGEITG